MFCKLCFSVNKKIVERHFNIILCTTEPTLMGVSKFESIESNLKHE